MMYIYGYQNRYIAKDHGVGVSTIQRIKVAN